MISDALAGVPPDARLALGSGANTSASDASAASGKSLPASGAPAAGVGRAPVAVDISGVIEHLNEFLRNSQRSLSFRVDEGSGRTVITVLNEATGEIVRQIPGEEVLSLARAARPGLLFDAVI